MYEFQCVIKMSIKKWRKKMKKLFIVFTLVSILFIRNISLSSVKAGIAQDRKSVV